MQLAQLYKMNNKNDERDGRRRAASGSARLAAARRQRVRADGGGDFRRLREAGLAEIVLEWAVLGGLSGFVCALGRRPRAQRAGDGAAQPRRQLKAAACL